MFFLVGCFGKFILSYENKGDFGFVCMFKFIIFFLMFFIFMLLFFWFFFSFMILFLGFDVFVFLFGGFCFLFIYNFNVDYLFFDNIFL